MKTRTLAGNNLVSVSAWTETAGGRQPGSTATSLPDATSSLAWSSDKATIPTP